MSTIYFVLALFAIPVLVQAQTRPIDEAVDLFNASSDEAIACYRIPALVTAPNGDLLAAI